MAVTLPALWRPHRRPPTRTVRRLFPTLDDVDDIHQARDHRSCTEDQYGRSVRQILVLFSRAKRSMVPAWCQTRAAGEQTPLRFEPYLLYVVNVSAGNGEKQAMEMIQGAEWVVVAIVAACFLISAYLVASVQGDLWFREESGLNTDEQATEMFIGLVNQTRRQIDIHDDGGDLADSMYNSRDVMDALRDRIRERNIKVRCLFNDADQPPELLKLARSEEYGNRIEIWHLGGGRQEPDTYYKIVDSGRLVHLSRHAHGASRSGYRLRKALRWWEVKTRYRISKQYRDHFEHGLKSANQAA